MNERFATAAASHPIIYLFNEVIYKDDKYVPTNSGKLQNETIQNNGLNKHWELC
jgi:hypothetical protein